MESVSTDTALGMGEEINRRFSKVGFGFEDKYLCTGNCPAGEMSCQGNSRDTKTRKEKFGFG